jgi:N-acetylglutamate synthase-like GNAT family acetyltransferase
MTSARHRIRRAIIDDLPALRALWQAMHFSPADLEKQLLEFQVAESPEGAVEGALGIQVLRQHARLHSEGYADFSVADAVRELFWERVQVLAANHGVFRLWTQERSPFWTHWGFKVAAGGELDRLPPEWQAVPGPWLTLQLKDEDTINAVMEREMVAFKAYEGRSAAQAQEQTRTIKIVVTVIALIIFVLCLALVLYLLVQRAHGSVS